MVCSTPYSSNGVVVVDAASLAASYSVSPSASLSLGGLLTVTLHVDNTGAGTASGVAPSTLLQGGTGVLSPQSGPTPSSVGIPGGTGADFVYTFSATGAGPVFFSLGATGTDALGVRASNITVTSAILLQVPASLSGSLTAPLTVNWSQPFNVDYLLTNSSGPSGETVHSASPTVAALAVAGAGLASGPVPAGILLAGGSSQNFVYSVMAPASSGFITLTVAVTGTANNTGLSVSDTRPLKTVLVQMPAGLTASAMANPGGVNVTQLFTLTLSVSNTGEAGLNAVSPSLVAGGAGAAVQMAAPSGLGSLSGGSVASFQWTFSASGAGQRDFTLTATGFDANQGSTVTASVPVSVLITPQQAVLSTLSSVAPASPGSVGIGGRVTLTVKVTNSGLLSASSVGVVVSPTVGLGLVNAPGVLPSLAANGGTAFFTFTYSGTVAGTQDFSIQAWGSDPTLRSSTPSPEFLGATVTVQGLPSISSFFNAPSSLTVSVGQVVTLVMTVSHTGAPVTSANVVNLNGGNLAKGGTASISTPMSSPVPGNVSVTPGGTQTFTYLAVPNGVTTGYMYFFGNATGFDANNGSLVSSASSSSLTITVQSPAAIASYIKVPGAVTAGQTFTVTLTVTNTGGADLTNIVPSISTNSGGQPVILNAGPSPASASLTSGAATTFQWTFDVIGSSPNIQFVVGAGGLDGNSGAAIGTGPMTTSLITVQSPPSISQQLDITNFTATPHSGCDFSPIYVVLTVTNTGTAAGTAALSFPVPDAPTTFAAPSLPGFLTVTSGSDVSGTVVSILGGATRRFTWVYSASASSATFNFSSSAVAASDLNSGAVVALPAISDPMDYTLTGSPQLSSALSVLGGNPMASGQMGTVILTVTNTGSADAVSVTPGALSPNPTGGAGVSGLSGPSPAVMTGVVVGSTVSFTWTFSATATLGGSGTLNFATQVGGLGQPGACQTLANVAVAAGPVTVVSSVSLSVSQISVTPTTVVPGQPVTITASIKNLGASVAQNVSLTAAYVSGVAGVFGPVLPASVSLAANQTALFSYVFTPSTAGTAQFSATGSAYDSVAGASITAASTPLMSPFILNVRNPVSLTSSVLMISPQVGKANRTQLVTVSLTVSNTASLPGNSAVGVTATVAADPAFTLLASPAAFTTLTPGNSHTFQWTYSCTTEGFFNFTASASGIDNLTLLTQTAAPAVISAFEVTTPTALLGTTINLPGLMLASTNAPVTNGLLALGTAYKLTFTVRNTGLATAAALTPSAALVSSLAISVTATSPSVASLLVGATTTFTWTFTPLAVGALDLTATVNAVTQGTTLAAQALYNTGAVYTVQNALLVEGPMTLAYVPVAANTISIGNLMTVRMTVSNNGGATAYNVSPSALPFNTSPLWLTFTPAVLNDANGLPVGGGLTVAAGSSATFRWVFTAQQSSGAPFVFSASASGLDPVGGVLATAITYSPGVSIGAGPSQATYLASSLVRVDGNPLGTAVGIGQLLTLRFSVSNATGVGSFAFTVVSPSASSAGTWSSVSLVSASYVTVTGASAMVPLSVTPGDSLVMDVVLLLSQTAQPSSSTEVLAVTLAGSYYDANYTLSAFPLLSPISFSLNVQAAIVANNHPVANEIFLSANTFTPPTQTLSIAFSVATSGQAVVRVYNINGELIKTLFDDQVLASSVAGQAILYSGATDSRLVWDGTADDGLPVSSGTYLIFIDAPGGFRDVKKVNLIR